MSDCSIPQAIEDEESIAHALFHPIDFKSGGKIKGAAFKAPSGKRDVSVMRSSYLTQPECCRRATEMQKDGKLFGGFAVLCVRFARDIALEVRDSRALFCGHADIWFQQPFVSGEPPPTEVNILLDALAKHALHIKGDENTPLKRDDCLKQLRIDGDVDRAHQVFSGTEQSREGP